MLCISSAAWIPGVVQEAAGQRDQGLDVLAVPCQQQSMADWRMRGNNIATHTTGPRESTAPRTS